MSLPWILIQYGTDGVVPSNPGTNGGPPPWGLITYGTNGNAPVIVPPTETPPTGGVGIVSGTKRSPAAYVDGLRRLKNDLRKTEIKSFEELKQAIEAKQAAEVQIATENPTIGNPQALASLLRAELQIDKSSASSAIEQIDDDEEAAIMLLLLN